MGAYFAYRWWKGRSAASTATPTTTMPVAATDSGVSGGSGSGGGGYFGTPSGITVPTGGHTRHRQTGTSVPTSGGSSVPVASPTSSAMVGSSLIPSPQETAAMLGASGQGSSLSPAQTNALSVLYQPQNQPAVNPYVAPTPVTQEVAGQAGPVASGTGTRYVSPGPNPYAFTFGRLGLARRKPGDTLDTYEWRAA